MGKTRKKVESTKHDKKKDRIKEEVISIPSRRSRNASNKILPQKTVLNIKVESSSKVSEYFNNNDEVSQSKGNKGKKRTATEKDLDKSISEKIKKLKTEKETLIKDNTNSTDLSESDSDFELVNDKSPAMKPKQVKQNKTANGKKLTNNTETKQTSMVIQTSKSSEYFDVPAKTKGRKRKIDSENKTKKDSLCKTAKLNADSENAKEKKTNIKDNTEHENAGKANKKTRKAKPKVQQTEPEDVKNEEVKNLEQDIDKTPLKNKNLTTKKIGKGKTALKQTKKELKDTKKSSTPKRKPKQAAKEVKVDNKSSVLNDPLIPNMNKMLQSVDHTDVRALLLHMEGSGTQNVMANFVSQPSTSGEGMGQTDDDEMMSDDDDDDDADDGNDQIEADSEEDEEWEDVADMHGFSPVKSQLPDKPVEITLDAPVIYKKKKKREFDLQAYFKRQINKFKREVVMDIHKVHLMCLLSRCQYLNTVVCQDDTIQALVMSVVMTTRELTLPSLKSRGQGHVTKIIQWLKREFPLVTKSEASSDNGNLLTSMVANLQNRSTSCALEMALLCVIVLRQLGFLTRLMMSLQPLPFKEVNSKAPAQKNTKPSKKSSKKKSEVNKSDKLSNNVSDKQLKSKSTNKKDLVKKKSKSQPLTVKDENEDVKLLDKSNEKVKGKKSGRKCTKRLSKDAYKDGDEDTDNVNDDIEYKPEEDAVNDSVILGGNGNGKKKGTKRSKSKEKGLNDIKDDLEEKGSDSDFEEDSILMRSQALRKTSPGAKNRRVLSSDSESPNSNNVVDEWVEVYLQSEKKWIGLDCVTGTINKPYVIEQNATQPVCYVIGIDNDGYMKDVTARYASQWLTHTRKSRVDADWWEATLAPYRCTDRQTDDEENLDLQGHLQQRPMPTSISGFKGHPLYALKRHLLKYEAIYPDTAIPQGYTRGEPVYARECVHTLHSRENWLKEGRCVRLGEEPYKFVKSRPKWNKPKDDPEAKDLELFGHWQTEVYIPPPAVNGKVPRNAHGNVEMFLPSMLPGGTVHLKIPGLNRVAKKLDIDCAPAMVGWDHHCGFSHPSMDGFIVCEEYKDTLLAAWDEEQEIIEAREAEKREKRVYENWRRLIRGMLIKERLKKRFDLEENSSQTESIADSQTCSTSSQKDTTSAVDQKQAWPQNRITGTQHTLCTVEQL